MTFKDKRVVDIIITTCIQLNYAFIQKLWDTFASMVDVVRDSWTFCV